MEDQDTTSVDEQVTAVRVLHLRSVVDRLDYLRALRPLAQVLPAVDIARRFGVTPESVEQAVTSAAKVPDPVPGFSSASPFEVAQRHAAGYLTREQMIDELSRWDYAPQDRAKNILDDLLIDPPGTTEEVQRAYRLRLIDAEAYEQVVRSAGARRGTLNT